MEEAWQEARAMVEYARDSEGGLGYIEVRHNRVIMKEIIKTLIEDVKMDPLDVFRRILPCSANVVLLEWFREEVLKGPAWFNLVDDIVRQPEGEWEEFDLSDMLPSIFGDGETLGHLLMKHRDVMRNPDSIFSSLNTSRGWAHCVRYCIANGNYLRAWDELKRAQKGLFSKEYDYLVKKGVPQSKKMKAYANPEYRINRINSRSLATLVRELHAAMCEVELLQEVSDDRASASIGHGSAGRAIAEHIAVGGGLSPESIMALRIADYFRVRDNERRRARAQERARMARASQRTVH